MFAFERSSQVESDSGATLDDQALAERLAAGAGAVLCELRARSAPGHPRELGDAGDRLAHEFLAAELAAHRPGDVILSEEGADDPRRQTADRVWIIDPLDGTREFSAVDPGGAWREDWAVHVALWIRGRGVPVGAVAIPARGQVFGTRGIAGSGGSSAVPASNPTSSRTTFRVPPGGAAPSAGPASAVSAGPASALSTGPASVLSAGPASAFSATLPADDADLGAGTGRIRLAVSRSHPAPVVAFLSEHLDVELLPMGSAGVKAMAVVTGQADAYVHDGGQYEWDSAAPVAVARAAGLVAHRLDGSPLEYNRRDPWLPDLLICAPRVAPALERALHHRAG